MKQISFRNEVKNIPSTTYGTFGLYRYPAKFIPQVIAYVLENYATPGMKIFDPFAGYGTVGVVSRIYGNDYELWDLNPMLDTLHNVTLLEPKEVELKRIINLMQTSKEEFIPDWSNIDYWFSKEFLPFLYKIWGFFHSIDNNDYLKDLLVIPLLKTTRHFSMDDLQRQKLSTSPLSKMRVKSLLTNDWEMTFYNKLETEINKVIKGLIEYSKFRPKHTRAHIRAGVDVIETNLTEEKNILITSPPYLQSQEYIRQAKHDLFWLGHHEKSIKKLSKLEIPYRNIEPQQIFSKTYSKIREDIKEEKLQKIFDNYFWATLSTFSRLQENIKDFMFLFVGRASMRGRPIPIDTIFSEHLTELGWIHECTLVDTIVSRRLFSYKKNPATNNKDQRTKTENLVVLKKP